MSLEIEEQFLDGGHFFGFKVAKDAAKQYKLFYQIDGAEFTTVEFELNAVAGTPTAVQASTGWRRVLFGTDTKLLSPPEEYNMYQIYIGIQPGSKSARLYQRQDGKDMRRIYSVVDGTQGTPYGYLRGNESPYDDPSKLTELFNIYDVEPTFLMWNNNLAVGGDTMDAWLKFYIMKYSVDLITDRDLVQRMINKQQRVRYFSFGPPEQPATAPPWLREHIKTYQELGLHGGGY